MKKIILVGSTTVVLCIILFKAMTTIVGASAGDLSIQNSSLSPTLNASVTEMSTRVTSNAIGQNAVNLASEAEDENDADIKVLRDQSNKERGIRQQIKLHNLELERTKVQLEQEKALAEMNQLRKSNLGIIKDSNGNGTLSLPDTKVVFLSISEKGKEAILSINGTNYTVKEGDKPLDNVLVKTINEKGVVIVINGEKEICLTPNLME